jgi:hypothetical protein
LAVAHFPYKYLTGGRPGFVQQGISGGSVSLVTAFLPPLIPYFVGGVSAQVMDKGES